MTYRYERSTDGTDESFDIRSPDGELLVSIHFWENADDAEAKARLIVDALNAYPKSHSNTAA